MRKKRPLFIGIMTFFFFWQYLFFRCRQFGQKMAPTETLLDDDYYIDTYHVDIGVEEDNTFSYYKRR